MFDTEQHSIVTYDDAPVYYLVNKVCITIPMFDWLLLSAMASCCEPINGVPLMASAVSCARAV